MTDLSVVLGFLMVLAFFHMFKVWLDEPDLHCLNGEGRRRVMRLAKRRTQAATLGFLAVVGGFVYVTIQAVDGHSHHVRNIRRHDEAQMARVVRSVHPDWRIISVKEYHELGEVGFAIVYRQGQQLCQTDTVKIDGQTLPGDHNARCATSTPA